MKRILLVLLILASLFAVSCTKTQGDESFGLEFSSEDENIDLNGYECVIAQQYPDDEPFKYRADTLVADLVLKRIADIGEDLNCNISFKKKGGEYMQDQVQFLIAGQYLGELVCTHQPSYLARAGVLYPLDVLTDYIDYYDASKYGSLGILEIGMFKSVPYTVAPVSWPEKQSAYSYNIMAINTRHLTTYSITDPRDLYEQGQWTWDGFEQFIANATFKEPDYTVKSFVTTQNFVDNASFSNGFSYTMTNSSGETISGVDSDNIKEALDWAGRLFTTYSENIQIAPNYEAAVNYFLDGYAVLYQTSFAHLIQSIVYESDAFGVVGFPTGPKGEYGKQYGPIADFDSMGILYNANEPEAAALIISRLFEPLDGYETIDALRSQANTIFFDPRDTELYLTYLGQTRWNYWTVNLNNQWNNLSAAVRQGQSSTEALGRYGDAMTAIIEEYIMGNADFINDYLERVGG